MEGWQTVAHGSNLSCYLFLYCQQVKYNFRIFKGSWEKKKTKTKNTEIGYRPQYPIEYILKSPA